MLGDFSIMDWLTFSSILANVLTAISLLVKLYRDKEAMDRNFSNLSKEHDGLSKEHDNLSSKITAESYSLSEKISVLKTDTTYICDELKTEKMARQALYQNSSRAKEILETMDLMREVVLQNAQLNKEVSDLRLTNQELILSQTNERSQLLRALKGIESKLTHFEDYKETEEIRQSLKNIASQLSEIIG